MPEYNISNPVTIGKCLVFASILFRFCVQLRKSELETAFKQNRICLMDVDIQGVEKLQKTTRDPICIFIRPRNFATLVSALVEITLTLFRTC